MIEHEDENNYNEAQTKSRNSISMAGISWAEVAAHNPQMLASRTSTNVSELTGATHSQPYQEKIKELKDTMKVMAEQIKQLAALIAQQMQPSPNPPQGRYYQQQPPPTFHQVPPQYRQWIASQQSTPNRNNGRSVIGQGVHGGQGNQTSRGNNKKTAREVNPTLTQPIEEEPSEKCTDDKITPTKETQFQLEAPPDLHQTQTAPHPYETACALQYRQNGINPQYMA